MDPMESTQPPSQLIQEDTTKTEISETEKILASNGISIEDYTLPKAVLTRIVKAGIPEGYHIQQEAKSALGKAAVVFINYMTALGQEVALKHAHKNLTAGDLLEALDEAEMGEFGDVTREALNAFKLQQSLKKSSKKKSTGGVGQAAGDDEDEDGEEGVEDEVVGSMSGKRPVEEDVEMEIDGKRVKGE